MAGKSKQELINEDNRDRRAKINSLVRFVVTAGLFYLLSKDPVCFKIFLEFLQGIISNNIKSTLTILVLIAFNILFFGLFLQERKNRKLYEDMVKSHFVITE